eukprot:3246730-Alexandrium_andersonii.AAC.1
MQLAEGDIIIDPAGLRDIKPNTPQKSSQASAAIYAFLGINKPNGFPTAVVRAIREEGQAQGHVYTVKGAQVGVVHVVGPDF